MVAVAHQIGQVWLDQWCQTSYLSVEIDQRVLAQLVQAVGAFDQPRGADEHGEREDGALEAIKFPREGAGLLSSLVDTDGLVELGEQVTLVEPGQTVGFLSYASLI